MIKNNITTDNMEITTEALLSSILIRLATLEKVVIDKKIIGVEELAKEINDMAILITRSILQKANIENVDEVMKNFNNN